MDSKNIKDYLHFYLGCEAYVQKKMGNESLVKGRVCEITRSSNHGDWAKVQFENVVDFMYYNFDKRSSNFHTFFFSEDHIKPILRSLSDMDKTEEMLLALSGSKWGPYTTVDIIILLKEGFDLFGLIDAGLAIKKSQ